MRHARTPDGCVPPGSGNAADDVFDNAARWPDHAAFVRKVGQEWHDVTAKQFATEVAALAAGLIAAGIRPGERVALMSATSYEWMRCDFAIWTAGAVTVPIYETSSPTQVAWILADSGAVAAFVEGDRGVAAVTGAPDRPERPVWRMTADGLRPLLDAGRDVPAEEVWRRRRGVGPDALATIVYTSGTTGNPKGCMITHGNLLTEVNGVAAAEGVTDQVLTERSRLLLFLPLAHILARMVQLVAVRNRAQVGHTSDVRNLPGELRTFRPTVVLVVPRVFETFRNTAALRAAAEGHARLFSAAETTAIRYSQAMDRGGPGAWLRLRHRLLDRLVYRKLRAALGGRTEYAVSGGAPLEARLGHFLRGVGIPVLEGWGLTETTSGATLNLPGAQRIGSVGRPVPGSEVRISEGGEVLVRGRAVFAGYWNNPEATEEVFEAGWFRTGDLGELDRDGYLTLTGRKKDLLVTAGGKNVAPAYFEDRLRSHWLIDQCVLIGDRRPYISALIVLNEQGFDHWKRNHRHPSDASMEQLREDPALLAVVQEAIDEVNEAVSRAEAIRRFRIVARPFTVGDELTPTQKVRRQHVLAKFADEVEALYSHATSGHARGDTG